MREGWCEIKLAQCVNNISKSYEIKTTNYEMVGKYPIVSQSEDLIAGYTDDDKFVIHLEKPVIVFGDHTRIIKFVDFDFCVGADGVKILSSKDFISPKFLFHFLQYKKVPSLGYSRHYKLLKEIDVIYPKSLSIQSNISDELDMITEMISKYDEQLKELDKLSQSIFYEMFGDPVENEKGWEVKKLGYICDVRDGTHDSPKYVLKSEYILITSKNIVNGKIDFENVNFITEEDYVKINKRSKVDDGDIIMPMIGTIGNPIIVQTNNIYKFCIKNVALIKFINEATIKNLFLLYLLKTTAYAEYLISLNKGGTQKFVSLGIIRNLPIILPPLALQQSFARKIEAIEAMKSKVREAKKEAETLLAARMQYWFE